jgi:phage terminase large subunit-like protein
MKRAGKDVVVTRGTTFDNRANLAPSFLAQIVQQYHGTRLGRQELNAEILDDVPGALWTREVCDRANAPVTVPDMARIVVAVDASGARGADDEAADSIGIIVAAKGVDGRAYVLADRSCKLSPAGWGRRAVDAFHEFRADRLIYERNFGGAMVEHVIRTADPNVACKEVVASRGKVVRAEPIGALYEQNRVSHVGSLAELEDQMCLMASDGYMGDGSPDRVDALVWALSDLMLGVVQPPEIYCIPFAPTKGPAPGRAFESGGVDLNGTDMFVGSATKPGGNPPEPRPPGTTPFRHNDY